MYVADDTRTMTFVLREVMHLHTVKIPTPGSTGSVLPGTLYRFVASPLSAMLKQRTNATTHADEYYTNTLGITASRWREIKYVGTRVQFVPLATTGRVDPADITQSASGVPRSSVGGSDYSPQGSIHPYDALNFIHWRRWTGGNFNIPKWDTDALATTDDAYIQKCLAYDQEWLADDRFNHSKLTDGMQFDSVPLRVDLETSALAGNSLFGFYTAGSLVADKNNYAGVNSGNSSESDAKTNADANPVGNPLYHLSGQVNAVYDPDLTSWLQPAGMIMPTAGKDYHEQGWLPNPFAGFTYTPSESYTPGDESWLVSGYWPQFPWFADYPSIASHQFDYTSGGVTKTTKWASTYPLDLNYLIKLCIERFLNPLAIIRLPPAYGSMFYWTVYMAHIFCLRKPFLTNSAWQVGTVQKMDQVASPVAKLAGDDDDLTPELVAVADAPIIQSIGADPYGLTESPIVMTLADLAPHMRTYSEPRHVGVGAPRESQEGDADGKEVTDS